MVNSNYYGMVCEPTPLLIVTYQSFNKITLYKKEKGRSRPGWIHSILQHLLIVYYLSTGFPVCVTHG